MNFSTDLPKSNPLVTYIVASAVECSYSTKAKEKKLPCFRMHAVILSNPRIILLIYIDSQSILNGGKGFILCHVRHANDEEDNDVHQNPIQHEISEPKEPAEVVNLENPSSLNEDRKSVEKKSSQILKFVDSLNFQHDFFAQSKKLIETIQSYKGETYRELYKIVSKHAD